MGRNVYTVGQVNSYIKNMFTQDFMLNRIYIKGEVSNCKYHTSGHIYFNGEASSIAGCFKDCHALEEIPYFPVNANSSLYETFYKCQNLKKIPTEWHFEEPSGF